MDMGQPSNERARLDALISAAAPDPLPAAQALPLLHQAGETDAAALGRLAYRALTGIDPGDDPRPPAEVVPGFPPFAAEVLMRAIGGPDHRRPTAQALLIVLDTVPLASWPGADRPLVTLEEQSATPAPEAVEHVEEAVEEAVDADEVREAIEDPAAKRAASHDEFRSLLTPSRSVPRFDPLTDPLTDPWEPGADDHPPIDLTRVSAAPSDEEAGPAAPQPAEPAEPEVVETDSEPRPEPAEAEADGADESTGMHDEFRNFVSPSFAVPHFEPLEGVLPAGSDRVRRRRTRKPSPAAEPERPKARKAKEPKEPKEPKPAKEPKEPKPDKEPKAAKEPRTPKPAKARTERATVANASSDSDRRQTLFLVGLLLVLVVLGVVYAARDSDEPSGGEPQGASRSTVQPSSVAV